MNFSPILRSVLINERIIWVLGFSILFLVCLFPSIPINSDLHIRPEDILLPVVVLVLVPQFKLFNYWYFLVIALWCFWGLISLFANDRLNAWNDYFEFYKLFKYSCFVVLFYLGFNKRCDFFKLVSAVFLLLLLFNFFHYYNILNFNKTVMPFYATNPLHLDFFGRNSLGGPDTKRIIGTLGNPNINGILFCIFNIYFMSFLNKNKWHIGKLFFYLSLGLILMTQSRTCLLAFFVYFPLFLVFNKVEKKILFRSLFFIVLIVLLVRLMDQYSLGYFTNAKMNVAENGSLRGRLEIWKHLGKMVLEKPLIGHGINKNYFYSNKLYSENEFLLMAWRYGLLGLLFYLSLLGGLIVHYRKNVIQKSTTSIMYVQLVILYGINALTNNPLSDPSLMVFFALGTGAFLSQFNLNEKNKVAVV